MERGKACPLFDPLKMDGFDGLSASVFMGISVDIHFWPAEGVKRASFVRLCITKTNFERDQVVSSGPSPVGKRRPEPPALVAPLRTLQNKKRAQI